MSARVAGFLVILDHDLRDDDAEATLNALRQIRGVMKVKPVAPDYSDFGIAEARTRREIADQLFELARKVAHGND